MTTPTTVGSRTAPTEFAAAGGVSFAYRRLGTPCAGAAPLVLIHHFMGTLDTHDPAVTDALARGRGRVVILFDNTGVGRSSGVAPTTIPEMAADAASFIRALGMTNVDVLGFSMGGEVAQQLALDDPDLVRRLVLVGTGPRGGQGMAALAPDVAPLFEVQLDIQERMWLPIFFSPSQASQASGERYIERIGARCEDRDVPVSAAAIAAQAAAFAEWGATGPNSLDYLARINAPALVINGSNDIIIPTINSYVLQQHLPDAELVIYPDSNHGSHFQYPDRFTRHVIDFLAR
ncbi:MAG: hypothetical protein QOG79_7539 [Mycobacterium sp.]|nr:hypothetical protein [Mycobacterium sp.]